MILCFLRTLAESFEVSKKTDGCLQPSAVLVGKIWWKSHMKPLRTSVVFWLWKLHWQHSYQQVVIYFQRKLRKLLHDYAILGPCGLISREVPLNLKFNSWSEIPMQLTYNTSWMKYHLNCIRSVGNCRLSINVNQNSS